MRSIKGDDLPAWRRLVKNGSAPPVSAVQRPRIRSLDKRPVVSYFRNHRSLISTADEELDMRKVTKDWGASQIGDLHGKTAIVTGANSGFGFHTALELGRAGARVIVACRDAARGDEALTRLRKAAPQ